MKKVLVVGMIVLFLGLAIAPSINANINRQSLEPTPEIIVEDYDGYNPVQLVFLLIAKLSRNREIKKLVEDTDNEVDIQKGIISIIETDWELNTIVEKIKGSDCDCDDADTTEWNFPVICSILFIPWQILDVISTFMGGFYFLFFIIDFIGIIFDCNWHW